MRRQALFPHRVLVCKLISVLISSQTSGLAVAAGCLFASSCTKRSEPEAEARASAAPASEGAAPAASRRPETRGDGPVLVSGQVPVAAFVSEELATAPVNGTTLVSVGASWCEPCQRFHRALAAGELDRELHGFRFIEYDFDVAKDGLLAAGYKPKFIPLFVLPKSDGTASEQKVEGSVKGDGAVADILPRLRELVAKRTPTEHSAR